MPTSPKDAGFLAFKEAGKAAGASWQRGIVGHVIDLIDVDLGPHPDLTVRCRDHGMAVVQPAALRTAIAARRKVLPVHL
jgi:hypothetical protein